MTYSNFEEPKLQESERDRTIEKWMPLWFNDFYQETRRMTTLQTGAYLKLIMEYWQNGCEIPFDDNELATIAGMDKRTFLKHKSTLMRAFLLQDCSGKHCNLAKKYQCQLNVNAKRKVNGSKGGKARMADWISSYVPECHTYVEVFADTGLVGAILYYGI